MAHASSSKICKYDVFLSFRGEDTRRNFVSHLYNSLELRGIRTFKDDERLETGKSISDELLKAIQESKFAIVIFSKSYASSRWCLEELAHIIKCKKELEQIVIPVFYDVSPSDVRQQHPPFAHSFSQHEVKYKDDMEKVQRWRGAFVEAGKISGYHLLNFKDEAECVKKLVDDIFPKSLQIISPFPESLVGMKFQVEKVTSLLDMESNDVRSIGIWGMDGIGKTEIANVLHQRYRHLFEADCFLGDVRELHQKNGLTWLQQVVIFKLSGKEMPLTSRHEGMNILKNMLRWKKVLFILDDVNHRKQLEFLVGGPEWFGMGSRIILTSRDKRLLISHVGDNLYEVQLLSEAESLELFSRHAFRERSPKEDFMELSRQVVKHAGGLPLALEVLGSSFYGQDKKHWRHIIDRLKRIPPKDILGKLRLSFDGLDKDEKELFLDIAFLEIACLSRFAFHLYVKLVQRDVSRGFLIDYLIEKSLLSINLNNCVVMHNMIREMGENVIREEYANSRIWLPEEVHDLFTGKLITEKVESLCIPKYYYFEDDLDNYSNIFKRMQSLQILIVGTGIFSSNCAITYLSSSLRFIDWKGYPSISLPESFEPSQLVVLCLCESRLVELWAISKKLSNLKHLDLMGSCKLTKTPNFGDMPNLEKLNLWRCVNLEEVHPSLGHCRMLTSLILSFCHKLKKLPKFVCMESLETLSLLECTSLQEFPEIYGDMHRLSTLDVGSPWIRSLPPSLNGLRYLQLTGCEVLECIPDTIRNLSSLSISRCNKLATLPNSLFESQLLVNLDIDRCFGLVKLPISLGVQKKLRGLMIRRCENLKKLPSSIQMESLIQLMISDFPKLVTLPEINGNMHYLTQLTLKSTGIREVPSSIGKQKLSTLQHLDLTNSYELTKTPNFGDMPNLVILDLTGCVNLEEVHPSLGHCRMLNSLRLPSCHKLKKLPKFVCMESLRELDLLECTSLQEFPEICGDMRGLSRLYLGSPWIRSLPPSLSGLRYLQLTGCEILESIPDTIRNLSNVIISGCNKLATLPNSLFESQLLENLRISDSPKFDTFPEINGDMHYLNRLFLMSTGIREVPSSIGNLSGLTELNLTGCEDLVSLPDSLCNLMNLQCLFLYRCKKLEKLPENMGDLQELRMLDAGKTAIYQPPPSITKLGKLWMLRFSHEKQLQHSSSFVLHQVSGLSSLQELHLNNLNILGGLPEDLGSLRELDVSGSNISCLPKSFKGLLHLQHLNVQFCQNLNKLPRELPPNLMELCADYHLALMSIRDLVIHYPKLCRLAISNCGAVSSEEVNVFLQHFLRTCIQCDFHQRDYFLVSIPGVRIPELFDYDCPFINQEKMSIDLNPFWYTDKFMGFWICYGPSTLNYTRLEATLVCKSDPERKYSLKYKNFRQCSRFVDPFICYVYIPFETLWNGKGNKEGKNPNDYCMLEVFHWHGSEEVCWGIRLEYEKEAMSDANVCL
ncbi:hypothetical protein R3W88_030849 [Solanum pinnatisectum]|uniref:ADP-ribosyl cyclase/cyclic ADP-ribose hydrolase n=1 Tax=Solanum pinnatisectum TaxID=50273 RepID=A0AAV9LJQ7_9SOLN|nr:hypothetical protein R3W88_030849 [Solanum pinnatisectum]